MRFRCSRLAVRLVCRSDHRAALCTTSRLCCRALRARSRTGQFRSVSSGGIHQTTRRAASSNAGSAFVRGRRVITDSCKDCRSGFEKPIHAWSTPPRTVRSGGRGPSRPRAAESSAVNRAVRRHVQLVGITLGGVHRRLPDMRVGILDQFYPTRQPVARALRRGIPSWGVTAGLYLPLHHQGTCAPAPTIRVGQSKRTASFEHLKRMKGYAGVRR